MSKLAEIAARSASRTRTVSHWDGQHLTTVIENVEPVVEATFDGQDADLTEGPEITATRNVETHAGTVHTAYRTVKRGRTILMPACDRFGNPARYHYLADTTKAVTCKKCAKHLADIPEGTR